MATVQATLPNPPTEALQVRPPALCPQRLLPPLGALPQDAGCCRAESSAGSVRLGGSGHMAPSRLQGPLGKLGLALSASWPQAGSPPPPDAWDGEHFKHRTGFSPQTEQSLKATHDDR